MKSMIHSSSSSKLDKFIQYEFLCSDVDSSTMAWLQLGRKLSLVMDRIHFFENIEHTYPLSKE